MKGVEIIIRKPFLITLFILTALFISTSASYAQLVYSHQFDFGAGYFPGDPQWDDWLSFRASLPASGVQSITVSGSRDSVGRTCSDPLKAQQIADAMRAGAAGFANQTITLSLSCDGFTWNTGACSSNIGEANNLELNVGPLVAMCGCLVEVQNTYILRPGVGGGTVANTGWGGIAGDTCLAPTQIMTVTVETTTVVPQPIVDALDAADIDPTIVPENVLNSLITADELGLLEVTPSDVVSDNFDLQQDAALVLGSGSQADGNIEGNESNTVVVGTDATVAGNIEGIGSLVYSSGAIQEGNLGKVGTAVFLEGASVMIEGNVGEVDNLIIESGAQETIDGNAEFLNELQMGQNATLNVNGNLICDPTATVNKHPTATIIVNGSVECPAL